MAKSRAKAKKSETITHPPISGGPDPQFDATSGKGEEFERAKSTIDPHRDEYSRAKVVGAKGDNPADKNRGDFRAQKGRAKSVAKAARKKPSNTNAKRTRK